VTPNKGYGPQFGETAYISGVNRARKIKSDEQVATNKNSDPLQKVFPKGWLERTVPPTPFFPNFQNCPKRVELGSSYSNCDKTSATKTLSELTTAHCDCLFLCAAEIRLFTYLLINVTTALPLSQAANDKHRPGLNQSTLYACI